MFKGYFRNILNFFVTSLAFAGLMQSLVACTAAKIPDAAPTVVATTSTVKGSVAGAQGPLAFLITAPTTVAGGVTVNIVLTVTTASGEPGTLSTVTASFVGGTSLGSFGAIYSPNPGQYILPYTGKRVGTPNSIQLVINGKKVETTTSIAVIPGVPSQIVIGSNNQSAPVSSLLSSAPQVQVLDVQGNPVPNLPLNLQVTSGGGTFNSGQTSQTVNLDSTGSTIVPWAMGPAYGPNTLLVTAGGGTLTSTITAYGYDLPAAVPLTSTNQFHEIDLSWAATTYTGGGTITYNVQRATASTGPFMTIANVTGTTFNDTTVIAASTYYYKVIVNNGYTTSAASNLVWGKLLFTNTWPFNTANASSYTVSNSSAIDFTSTTCELTASGMNDANSAAFATGTASGIVYGTLADGVQTGLKLGSAGSCDGSTTNCSMTLAPELYELNSTWTPEWSNLTGYWKLNEAAGTTGAATVLNSKTGTNDGTPTSVIFGASGKLGTSATFSTSKIDLTTTLNTTKYTKSAWIYPTGSGGVNIFSASANTAHAFYLSGLKISGYHNGVNYFSDTTAIPVNTWTHVAITFDSSVGSGTMVLYKNGVRVGGATSVPTPTGNTLSIGSLAGGNYYTGAIDEVALWNIALDATEIGTLYARQAAKYSGIYTSHVADALASSSWTDLIWKTTLPFFKELPDAGVAETTADYPSLVTPTPVASPAALAPVALWHLDEAAGTSGANTIIDSSGNGHNGTPNGGYVLGRPSKFRTGVYFDGTATGYINTNYPFQWTTSTSASVSFWINPATIAVNQGILGTGAAGGFGNSNYSWTFRTDTSGNLTFCYWNSGGGANAVNSTVTVGTWDHFVATYDPVNYMRLYKNGIQVASLTTAANFATPFASRATPITIGHSYWNGGVNSYFNGSLDEIGFWTRALSANEIKQMYQRGAGRIKLQVKSCAQANCSDGVWKGPDGTANTYFSELNNTSVQAMVNSGTVKAAAPDVTIQTYGTPAPANRYFQYRTIFESDSGTTSFMPELKSVMIGPIHFDQSAPTLVTKTSLDFNTFMTFTDDSASSCASPSSVTYNLSPNGTTWYYWNGTAWVSGGSATNSNTASALNTLSGGPPAVNPISQYSVGSPKTVFIKTYLKSDGTHPCSFSKIQTVGN